MVECLVPKAIAEQLTIVACDAVSGQLVGALLADDFGTTPPEGLDDAAPQFAPVGALLDTLDEPYRADTAVAPGTHAHLFMLGVAAQSASRGIAGQLVAACLAQAHGLGYRTAVTEATGAASQQVFRRAGFHHVATASYRDFVYGGERVFSAITVAEGTFLMTRDLDGRAPLPGTGVV
jgi:ribosomal protein S18 acetylase RimI-like enzyme